VTERALREEDKKQKEKGRERSCLLSCKAWRKGSRLITGERQGREKREGCGNNVQKQLAF